MLLYVLYLALCLAVAGASAWPSLGLGLLRGLLLRLYRRRFRRPLARCLSLPPACVRRTQAKPAWVTDEIIRLKALMPEAGCRRIASTFNRLHLPRRGMSVSKSYVAAVVRVHQVDILRRRREIKHRVPRPQPRNLTWGLDLTGKQDGMGEVHSILGLLDHGSRRLLALCLCPRRNALTLLGHLFLAMGRHGMPRWIRTDNDAVFTSRVFRWGLGLVGVRQQRSDPGCPWQNGRIERLFGTLKQHLDRVGVCSGAALSSLLDEFGLWYNHVRPHQHLNGATPMEAWQGIDPYRLPLKGAHWVSFWEGRLTGYWLRR